MSESNSKPKNLIKTKSKNQISVTKPDYIQSEVSLKNYNTWKTGGLAEYFAMPESLEQYKDCISWAINQKLSINFLGQGSNALISDQGLSGLVLCSKKFQNVDILSEDQNIFKLKCESGALKFKVMRLFLKNNLSPALFLSGIPGDVGGGVVMNAGVGENSVPREFCEIVESFKVLKWQQGTDGQLGENIVADINKKINAEMDNDVDVKFTVQNFKHEDIVWSYRSSKNWQPGFIFEVNLATPMNPIEGMAEKVKAAINNRKLKQPWDKPSCGSVFVNPENHRAGQLIEATDLKGFQIGGAQVSYKHANFIVNTGQGTSQDIHRVIEHVKTKVFEKFKVSLHTEVVYLGPWDHMRKS